MGGNKNVRLIRESITPPHDTLIRVFIIKIESIIKRYPSWQRRKRSAQLSNILFLQALELHWPGRCLSIVYRHVWLGPLGQVLCSTVHMGYVGWDLRNQGRCSQVHYWCTFRLFLAQVHYWCTFRLFLAQWERKLRAKASNCTQSELKMLIIFTRAADCISMEKCTFGYKCKNKYGGGVQINIFKVSKLIHLKS